MSGQVALFLPSLLGGGAERVAVNLARGLSDQGVSCDLVLVRAEGPYRAEAPAAVRIVDLGARRVGGSLPALVRYLRRARPRVLMSSLVHCNIAAALAHRLAGVPTRLVVSEHIPPTFGLPHMPRRWARWLFPYLVRPAYSRADRVVAVSHGTRDDFIARFGLDPARVVVIYNPVVTPELEELGRQPAPHPWLADGASPVILGVGRLHRQKNFAGLIEAFARVRRQRPARLLILGEGAERPRLAELVAQLGLGEVVDLPGFVDNPFAAMARARLFVLSSGWEGLPGALIQALAMGCPVVSTDCPSGPAEILEGGRHGRLVPVGDVEALAAAMLAALGEEPDREALRRRADEFRLERAVARYREVLEV